MAPTSRLARVRLMLAYAFYCCISLINLQDLPSIYAQALLYHKVQPGPAVTPAAVLSRVNRQPNSSDSYYNYQSQHNQYNRQQQQQPTSYLTSRDSTVVERDFYDCPVECHCNKIAQIADCSNRNLTRVPASFPKDIKRIRLERNNITEIGPYAFQGLKRLQRIDLSNNNLYKIDTLAFSGGLQALNSLILYSNKLEHLPVEVFSELSQLQLLLLNANSLQEIQKDLFQALTNLNLLSLYDNNLVTLPEGAFEGLKGVKTIHLGKNPLHCDCNLRWLVEYFETNPVETSEARCESPGRTQGKKLSQLNKSELTCHEHASKPVQQQPRQPPSEQSSCPAGCICNGSTVDCSQVSSSSQGQTSDSSRGQGGLYEMPDVPDDLPVYVAKVHINDNRIKRIRQTGLFKKLANSQKLDLGNNKIVDVEDNAVNGHLPNGQKPERVIFVLLENQHCDAPSTKKQPPAQEEATESSMLLKTGRQQQLEPCARAPKVNEPHFDSPCYNGGTCKPNLAMSPHQFSCLCPPGFGGPLCEINIDDCVDHQCQNGAMCVDGINSYKCICRDPTTSGEYCEQLVQVPFNEFNPPYATSSANSIAPMALPMIAHSTAPANNVVQAIPPPPPPPNEPQILERSADFLRQPDDLAANSLQASSPSGPTTNPKSCQRVTRSKYFDDGNGCQSVRLLKINECLGTCDSKTSGTGGCCAPAKIKRRRIHMQCSDGASYVKVIDLVKKCSCSQDIASCPAQTDLFGPTTTTNKPNLVSQGPRYFRHSTGGKQQQLPSYQNQSFNVAQDDMGLQITHLDAAE